MTTAAIYRIHGGCWGERTLLHNGAPQVSTSSFASGESSSPMLGCPAQGWVWDSVREATPGSHLLCRPHPFLPLSSCSPPINPPQIYLLVVSAAGVLGAPLWGTESGHTLDPPSTSTHSSLEGGKPSFQHLHNTFIQWHASNISNRVFWIGPLDILPSVAVI